MMKDKKGMQIAITTVVGLILGLMMLFAGFALFGNIMVETTDLGDKIDADMERQILDAFDTNDPIYVHRATIEPKRNEDAVFWVGIHNTFNETTNFKVEVETTNFDVGENVAFIEGPYEIVPREKEVVPIIVSTRGLEKGQHSLTVKITYGDEDAQYHRPRILYVNI